MGFEQNGSIWKQIVTLKDASGSGSPLFSGSPVYCFANSISYSNKIFQGRQPKVLPLAPDFVGSNVGSVWNKLKVNNSFGGMENPGIKMSGTWTTNLGSQSTDGLQILTPYKILLMASSGRTFYLKDERIIEQMIIESGSQLYSANGIPVVIDTFDLTANMSNLEGVNWSLNLTEDKV